MADVESTKAHGKSLEEARKTAEQIADELKSKYNLDGTWQGNTLKFAGSGVKGQLEVDDTEVRVSISLGMLLKAFKGKIQGEIDKNLDKLFA